MEGMTALPVFSMWQHGEVDESIKVVGTLFATQPWWVPYDWKMRHVSKAEWLRQWVEIESKYASSLEERAHSMTREVCYLFEENWTLEIVNVCLGYWLMNSALMIVGYVSTMQVRMVWCASFLARLSSAQLLGRLREVCYSWIRKWLKYL